ncbi:uncharacterized protein LOC123596224 [Leopardus geoffroyi]|uniref:uncharacterized protein LOC123596224 n=1 Tax=Leopardus geoffroyi TaxID=46844 RepID=UPI001E263043|nr:uncharacterized protein LOC123596224 [Leopardus geoffroyi]XP_045330614.1 uncharacterized protein LOC123596224 [Leopardus geoffroyi]
MPHPTSPGLPVTSCPRRAEEEAEAQRGEAHPRGLRGTLEARHEKASLVTLTRGDAPERPLREPSAGSQSRGPEALCSCRARRRKPQTGVGKARWAEPRGECEIEGAGVGPQGDRELRVHGPSCAGGSFPATSPTETSPLCPAPAPTGGPTEPPWASGPLPLPGPVPLGKVLGTRGPVTINPVSRQNLPAHLFLEPEVAHPSSKGPVFSSQVLPRLSHPAPLWGGGGILSMGAGSPPASMPLLAVAPSAPSPCHAGDARVASFPGPLRRGEGLFLARAGRQGWRGEVNQGDDAWASSVFSSCPRVGRWLWESFSGLPAGHQEMSNTSPGAPPSPPPGSLSLPPTVGAASLDSVPRGGCHPAPGEAAGGS